MYAFQVSEAGLFFQQSDTVDGDTFILRCLQAKTNVQTDVLDERLYIDDMDKNFNSEIKMQRVMDQVSQSCVNYDLTISTKIDCTPGKPFNKPLSL